MNGLNQVKRALYASGVAGAYHRLRNRRLLTVAMFHRVLPAGEPRQALANAEWTVRDDFFADCLQFFARHYSPVGVEELVAALEGRKALPARPLLITFDDGWSDVEEFAGPLLARMGMPAVVFMVAGEVAGDEPWQDTVRRAWRLGHIGSAKMAWIWESAGAKGKLRPMEPAASGVDGLISAMSMLPAGRRDEVLGSLRAASNPRVPRQMMTAVQLRRIAQARIAIGSHGFSHTSLTLAGDPKRELAMSRAELARVLETGDAPVTLSFPNGRYDVGVLRMAEKAGYRCVFTSEEHLNRIRPATAWPAVLGRIPISAAHLAGADGRLRPEQMAAWLFRRPAGAAGERRA